MPLLVMKVEDQGHGAEVEEKGRRQIEQGFERAHPRDEKDREHDEALAEDDGGEGEQGVDAENERRVAEQEPPIDGGDDGAFGDVPAGDPAGGPEAGDDLGEGLPP